MADEVGSGMPALLMHAAQSAARADGLVTQAPEGTDAPLLSHPLLSGQAAPSAALSSTSAAALLQRHRQQQQQQLQQRLSLTGGTSTLPPPPPVRAAAPTKKGSQQSNGAPPLRRGKWTPEEEAYANRLIQEFKAGLLPLTDGTTLRTFLSKLLNCDPMRISKKFVGANCIGKQVFRRRQADMQRLTPEQIQQSRAELSELERRFLERVAATNRVKNTATAPSSNAGAKDPLASLLGNSAAAQPSHQQQQQQVAALLQQQQQQQQQLAAVLEGSHPTPAPPPWLQPPMGYQHGAGAALARSRAAAAGRALLGKDLPSNTTSSHGTGSSNNLLAASAAALLRSAAGSSLSLTGATTAAATPAASLTNMIQRQNSLDALMGLDFQSIQSIDNLANLMQQQQRQPEAGIRNADFGLGGAPGGIAGAGGSTNWLRKSLSSSNGTWGANALGGTGGSGVLQSSGSLLGDSGGSSSLLAAAGSTSAANLSTLLQSMSNLNQASSVATANNSASALNLSAADLTSLLQQQRGAAVAADPHSVSSTGLSALRRRDGLATGSSSVDDFLSLVAAGDIPHENLAANQGTVPPSSSNDLLKRVRGWQADEPPTKR